MVEFHGNNNQVEGHSGGFWHHVQINEFNQRVGIVRLCCKVLPREYGCMWGTTNLSPSMENICGWGIKHPRIKHHGNVGVTRGYKDGAFFAVGISGIKQWGRIRSITSRVLSQSQRQESFVASQFQGNFKARDERMSKYLKATRLLQAKFGKARSLESPED